MQAYAETIFDAAYLTIIIWLGVLMVRESRGRRQYFVFGIMALGVGKLITSITMTIFYVLLYYVWRLRYRVYGQHFTTLLVYILAAARIVLCLMPQNEWLSANPPLLWGILRNIPFALLGVLIIVLFYKSAHEYSDRAFRWMWLTIVLSFSFYIPVVLFAHVAPMVGMLMIPKTLAYIWTVVIGYRAMRLNAEPGFRSLR